MLSGIGPSSHLASFGIETVVDHPAVGQNLTDHSAVGNQFRVAKAEDDPDESIARNTTLYNELLQEWEDKKQGMMATNSLNHIGWLRLPTNDTIWKTDQDPSAGPATPHYELLFEVIIYIARLMDCRAEPSCLG